jgi:hypothetical protein
MNVTGALRAMPPLSAAPVASGRSSFIELTHCQKNLLELFQRLNDDISNIVLTFSCMKAEIV